MAISGSRGDFARLGIYIDATGAVSTVKSLDSELKKLGTSGDRVAGVVNVKTAPSLRAIEGTAKGAHLATGRLGNQFANLAGQLAGVHPIIGNVASVMGNFALGAGLTVGVLLGLAAIAKAWDVLTASARGATKAQDDALKRLAETAKMKAAGPGGQTTLDIGQAYARLGRLQTELDNLSKGGMATVFGAGGRKKEIAEEMEAVKALITLGEIWRGEAEAAANKPIKTATAAIKEFAVAAQQAAINWREFVETYAAKHGPTLDQITDEWARETVLGGVKDYAVNGQFGGGFSMPNVTLNDGLTKEQIKSRDALIGNADQNTGLLRGAIYDSAQIIGAAVVQAVNIGGGGRGSGIGGALGSGIGGAIGSRLGFLGGPIGAVVGGLAGSFIGGLFDKHEKAVAHNTNAVRALTQAMLLNAPSVYKVAGGRFDATDIKPFQRATTRYATRGGAPVMVVA